MNKIPKKIKEKADEVIIDICMDLKENLLNLKNHFESAKEHDMADVPYKNQLTKVI